MESVQRSLSVIEDELTRFGRGPTLERLRAGVSRDSARRALESVGLRPPADLLDLYAWHNGTDTTGAILDDLHLWPGFYFLSIEDAVANHKAFVRDKRWDKTWFPVFANGGGDFYAVVSGQGHTAWGEIIHFRIDEVEQPIEFHSVQALLATLAAAYQEGIFFVEDRGYLEMKDVEFIQLANRIDQIDLKQ